MTRGRSKNKKIWSFNGQTHFCLMPFVSRVTPGTVNVKISAAKKAVMKACKVQNGYKFANINFETCLYVPLFNETNNQ